MPDRQVRVFVLEGYRLAADFIREIVALKRLALVPVDMAGAAEGFEFARS